MSCDYRRQVQTTKALKRARICVEKSKNCSLCGLIVSFRGFRATECSTVSVVDTSPALLTEGADPEFEKILEKALDGWKIARIVRSVDDPLASAVLSKSVFGD